MSSVCPLVWDSVEEPTQPPIAISRIFCGQISNVAANSMQVFGFGASIYTVKTSGNLCLYKGGIKDIPCYTVKGQRMVPVAKGKWKHTLLSRIYMLLNCWHQKRISCARAQILVGDGGIVSPHL